METQKPGNVMADGPKESISVRGTPALIYRLQTEANKLGMKLAPYCESLLNNFKHVEGIGNKALSELEQAKNRISLLESQLATAQSKISLLQTDAANDLKVIEEIKKQNSALSAAQSVFNNKRLLWFFEKLKGKTIHVNSPYGEHISVTHNEPKDVLITLIHSSKLD